MKKIRVLVVDDSEFARELICSILEEDSAIEVIGKAVNGRDAAQKAAAIRPDIITMDIDMPVMNGIEAIETIMATRPVPILVVTSHTDKDTAFTAISKGALEVLPKPDIGPDYHEEFIHTIKVLSQVKTVMHVGGNKKAYEIKGPLQEGGFVLAVASSTGGPGALEQILAGLPGNLPFPVLIAQHISEDFSSGMAQWLDTKSKLNVHVAKEGETITPGNVYISPTGTHLKISTSKKVSFIEKAPRDSYSPSGNVLLSSVADVYGPKSIGIILTGMGNDGSEGIKAIKAAGGITIAQDKGSCVIFSMPDNAIKTGCIDRIMPLEQIADEIVMIAGRG